MDLQGLFWDGAVKPLPVMLLGYVKKDFVSLLESSNRGVKTGHELIGGVLTGIHCEQCSFLYPFPLIGKIFGNPGAARC